MNASPAADPALERGLTRLFWIFEHLLGLAYSMIATDALIAPAFASNTARAGVLYPVVYALAESNHSYPDEDSRKRVGAYLMMTTMAGLSLSSGLWLTAMGANPIGAALAAEHGVIIDFGSWFLAASVPTITALVVIPWMLYRVYPAVLKSTPHAPAEARAKLEEMGPLSAKERTTLVTFIAMVAGCVAADKAIVQWVQVPPCQLPASGT